MKNVPLRPLNFPIDHMSTPDNVSSSEQVEQHKVVMFETLALFITPEIQRVVEFAKRIPGFAELPQEDQLVLIKTGFFEIWLLRLCRQFNVQQQTLILCDGSFLHREQLDLIYSPELVSAMFQFSAHFNTLHLSDGEVGLFTAVVLLTADRPGLQSVTQTESLREQLTEALKLQLSRSHSSDPNVYTSLLARLPDLTALGHQHHSVLAWYRHAWRRLQLQPLFAEIYDITSRTDLSPLPSHNTDQSPGNVEYDTDRGTSMHLGATSLNVTHNVPHAVPHNGTHNVVGSGSVPMPPLVHAGGHYQ